MFLHRKAPDFEEAFRILTDERSSRYKLKRARRALFNKKNTPHEYMALAYLCAFRGFGADGDPIMISFDLLLAMMTDHSFFDEINAAVSSPFVFKTNERAALRHDYYALSYLAWAYHFGWCVDKNDEKAKELVARARKVDGKFPLKAFNESVFEEIERL